MAQHKHLTLGELTKPIPPKHNLKYNIAFKLLQILSKNLKYIFQNSFSMIKYEFYIPDIPVEELKKIFDEQKIKFNKYYFLNYKASSDEFILNKVLSGQIYLMHKYKYLSFEFIMDNFDDFWDWIGIFSHQNLTIHQVLILIDRIIKSGEITIDRFKDKNILFSIINRKDITEDIILSNNLLYSCLKYNIIPIIEKTNFTHIRKVYLSKKLSLFKKYLDINNFSKEFIENITGCSFEELKNNLTYMLTCNISYFTKEDIDNAMSWITENINDLFNEMGSDYKELTELNDISKFKKRISLTYNPTFPDHLIRHMYEKYPDYMNWEKLTENTSFNYIVKNPDLNWSEQTIFNNKSLTEVNIKDLLFTDIGTTLFNLNRDKYDKFYHVCYIDLMNDYISFDKICNLIMIYLFTANIYSIHNNTNISLKFVLYILEQIRQYYTEKFSILDDVVDGDKIKCYNIERISKYKKQILCNYFCNKDLDIIEEHSSNLVKKTYLKEFIIQCCYNPASKFRRDKLEKEYDEQYSK